MAAILTSLQLYSFVSLYIMIEDTIK